jgi:dTDP-4-dehydrorhamnose reductase
MVKVAVIGMGYLGTQIVNEIRPLCNQVVVTHQREPISPVSVHFDILESNILDFFSGRSFDYVFITAKVEFTTRTHALFNGMRRLVRACRDSRIVYFSSDGVYAGLRGRYQETDLSDAQTLYGGNLALCEQIVAENAKNFLIIRPSYIYGYTSAPKQVLDSRLRNAAKEAAEGKTIERFRDMYRSPMHVRQVAAISVQLAISEFKGIVHVAGPRMSVADFVKEGLEAMELPTDRVIGVPKPDDPITYPADNSLDTSLMQELTHVAPMAVLESFRAYNGQIL